MKIPPVLTNDTDDEDNNPNTDKMITMSWISFPGQWPNVALPKLLSNHNFSVKPDAEYADTVINLSVFEHDSSYDAYLSHGTVSIINLMDDIYNCGAIGDICEYDHAEDLCVNGECVMGACEAGYLDLNNDSGDGCEYSCTISNGGEEICDGLDNNCDGLVDNGDFTQYTGSDTGECQKGITACVDGQMQQTQQGIGPNNEVCDNLDNDCDGFTDEG